MSRFIISTVATCLLLNVASAALSPDWTAEEQWPHGELNCAQGYREFDKITQKRTYQVGIHAPAGVETAYREHNMTFDKYLNEAVGKRWDPPIEFKIKVTDDPLRDWIDYGEEVDFMYTDTGIFSCIGIEIGAQPIGTTISRLTSRGRDYTLDIFAGTMMVLKTNRDINSVQDLKDKVIGAQAFSDFAGAQAQFYVMKTNGLDYIVDPKQPTISSLLQTIGNNGDTVQGILDGRWDVGFVRTGQAHRIIDPATGDYVDPSVFKVLDPRIHIMDSGEQFPFLHSTPVFPEWTLSAKDNIDRIVSEEVAKAMINFHYHNSIGEAIHQCREEATSPEEMNICDTMPPVYFDPKARCDTTRELAELAREAGIAGFHNGFRSPRSYNFVRTMQQDAGFIVKDEYGNWHCERAASLYDGITCSEGQYKVREEDFKKQCENAGTPCPEGYHCYCKPCIKAFEVSVFPVNINSEYNLDKGCDKMSLCGKTEQTKEIAFHAFDNRKRENVTVTALVHLGQEERHLPVKQLEPFLYEFGFSHTERGVAVVEIYFDEVQIPESPVRVEVSARDCDADYPGLGKTPNNLGECVCSKDTVEVGDSCLSFDNFEVSVIPFSIDGVQAWENVTHDVGCGKMSLCGTVEQNKEILFHAFDNRLRDTAKVSALMHIGQEVRDLPIRKLESYTYEFGFSQKYRGVAILEISVDGVQIPESPIRVEITSRNCEVDYPNENKVANSLGLCECSADSIEIGDDCVPLGTFAAIMVAISLLVAFQIGWCINSYRKRKNDEMWHVHPEELNFSHPAEVIGQGAFGVVLAADYRGTRVAIKRVVPVEEKARRRGSSNTDAVRSLSDPSTPESEANSDPEIGQNNSRVLPAIVPMESSRTSSNNEDAAVPDFFDALPAMTKKTVLRQWLPSFFHYDLARSNLQLLGTASGTLRKKSFFAMLCPRCDETTRRQQDFLVEMRLLSRLRHPCITTIMGAVMTGSEPMMVMECMENGSLYDLLRNETVFTGGEMIMQIVRDVAQGLRFLHSSKPPILHRDLKAKNILIDSRFRAKVADFGLSSKNKHGWHQSTYRGELRTLLLATFILSVCNATSVFASMLSASLICSFLAHPGMILYEIYSRKIPYEGENPSKVLFKVCDPRVNYRPRVPSTCPKRMEEIMKKCWSGNAGFRPEARDLDMKFTDMSAHDAEPVIDVGTTRLRTEVAAGDMLYQVFPRKVADQLKAGQKVEAETHDNVTVFFSDIVRFTDISREMPAVKVCEMLDRLYLAFDDLANKHEVFKVETIGDAWVGVTNLEGNQNGSHVRRIAEFAVDAVAAASNVLIDEDNPGLGHVHIRVGFHSGQVVSNVIGSLNPRYGLFGDTMNTASRMEHLSASGKIQCSDISARLLQEQAPDFPLRRRGKVAVKGKGHMTTYWVGSSLRDGSDLVSPSRSFDDDRQLVTSSQMQQSPTKVNMAGSLRSSVENEDPCNSTPLSWRPYSKKGKKRFILEAKDAAFSQ
eukprot:scaffold1172_cov115-Cylindrotheca_fusiformis.AAC.9